MYVRFIYINIHNRYACGKTPWRHRRVRRRPCSGEHPDSDFSAADAHNFKSHRVKLIVTNEIGTPDTN